MFLLYNFRFVRLTPAQPPAASYQKRLKPVQVVNFHGGAVKNAVLAVFLRRYAAAAAQNVGQRQLVIGQHQLDRAHAVAQHIVQLGQKLRQAAAGPGARQQNVRVKRNGVRHIAFVVDHQLGDALAVKAAQNLIGHGQLLGGLGIARIGHLDDDVGERRFLQRGFERLDQMVRQPADKADRIHQNNLQTAGQHQLAGGGVQRGKQHVGLKDLLAAQGVQQAGFAHIGVADQRHHGHIVLLAGAAGLAAALFHFLQLFFQMLNAVVQVAAVKLQLGLTGAALTAQAFAQPLQARQLVAQCGKLGLQLALVRGGAGTENFKDQHRAVQHLKLQRGGEVADLAAGQLAVKNRGGRVHILADKAGLGDLALTQHRGGLGRGALLYDLGHGVHAVGIGQCAQLVQTAGHIIAALIQRQQHHGQLFAVGGLLGGRAKVKFCCVIAHNSSFSRW